jgi:hypothetical protein
LRARFLEEIQGKYRVRVLLKETRKLGFGGIPREENRYLDIIPLMRE